ncbi:hypothetical protein PIROE2DRAFT_18937 [Piromyces sp. E2]|nr:hypothetical protein PIROE2DRAFT_18937 [Piromyces sp. E2]|eukprot:OUM56458.1 hypothetical protein PIROE2DRAFT_18937 [Piromyces sp. E2]
MPSENVIEVTYKGIECRMYKSYMTKDDGPLLLIIHSKDIDKAYKLGFDLNSNRNYISIKIDL